MQHPIKQLVQASTLSAFLVLALTTSCSSEEDLDGLETNTADLTLPEVLNLSGKEVANSASVCDQKNGINPTSKRRPIEREYLYSDINSKDPDVNRAASESINNTIDDRTCTYNYSQINVTPNGQNMARFGRYRIRANSNNIDNIEPRIERASVSNSNVRPGGHVTFTGDVLVRSVGNFTSTSNATKVGDRAGTYIAQAKGKDNSGNPGSSDPAIALILVKPTNRSQTKFAFYLELIKTRRGSGSEGRTIRNLGFSCNKNDLVRVKLVNRIVAADNSIGKRHQIVVRLDNLSSSSDRPKDQTFGVPDPGSATSIKIRYGSYRCKAGDAEILWKNVKITKS